MRFAWCAMSCLSMGCTAVVDPGLTFSDCQATELTDDFDAWTSLEPLEARCWQTDNLDDPGDIFVDDGDVVLRQGGARWSNDQQAPLLFQPLAGDFVMAARVEALNKLSGDHCLEETDLAGLVLRDTADRTRWAHVMLGPFMATEANCVDDAEVPPPTQVVVDRSDGWGVDGNDPIVDQGDGVTGLGEDGEATLGICRLDELVGYYSRVPGSDATWHLVGTHSHAGKGLDVGFSATSSADAFDTEGHVNWVVLERGVGSDGCAGTLQELVLPEDS